MCFANREDWRLKDRSGKHTLLDALWAPFEFLLGTRKSKGFKALGNLSVCM